MSNNRMSDETLNKLRELDIKHMHINNGGKELTDEDYLRLAMAVNEALQKHKIKNTLD